jgi:predicted methyltransferase
VGVLAAIAAAGVLVSAQSGSSSAPSGRARQAAPAQKKNRLFPPTDLGLLEAPDRDEWQKPDLIMDALKIGEGDVVADLGAGGGWFTVRLARRVWPNGLVYAQDIQPTMLEVLEQKVQREGLNNVRTVLGTPTDPKLPLGLDAVLIVDAYHEMDDPARPDVIVTLVGNVARSLKPQGLVGIVDFLPGGGGPGPAADERISPETVIRTAERAGLVLNAREAVPPFQFLLVFGKGRPPSESR